MPNMTISVLLTCGNAEYFPNSCGVKNKALLPINGQSLFEYTLKALCNSRVEKVFVIQEADSHLENIGTCHEKVIYANCKTINPSLAESLVCALEKLIDFYGENELQRRYIMFVPCDIPLVKSKDFDTLISQTRNPEVDIYCTLINNGFLHAIFPERHFRSMYFKDLSGFYSQQALIFVSGRLFKLNNPDGDLGRVAVCDRSSQSFSGLADIINIIRSKRSSLLGWIRFFSLLLWEKMISKRQTALVLELIYGCLFHRLTVSLLEQVLYKALNVKFAFIETSTQAFSADIDTPRDLENISKMLYITTVNNLDDVLVKAVGTPTSLTLKG